MKHVFSDLDLFSRDIPVWDNLLGSMKGMPDLEMLEVGCCTGRRTEWLLKTLLTHPSSKLTCIDEFGFPPLLIDIAESMHLDIPAGSNRETDFDARTGDALKDGRLVKRKAAPAPALRTLPLSGFDLIVIDGLTDTREMLTLAVLGFDLLKTEGVLILDGFRQEIFTYEQLKNPRTGIETFLEGFEGEYVPFWKENQVFLRRLAERSVGSPDSLLAT